MIYQSPLVKESQILHHEEIFNNNIPIYQQALKNSGFNNILTYRYSQSPNLKIIWFNLPFLTNVKANIAKIFFKLLYEHFPKTNKLYKIFNKNTVTIGYTCVRNMGCIILAHNQHLLTLSNSSFRCNCRNKSNCSLEEKCLTPKVIYQTNVTNDADNEYKFSYDFKKSSFKERLRNHSELFNHQPS